MAIKITSRFSPSIIRAAQALETFAAAAKVPFDSELYNAANKVFFNSVDDYERRIAGVTTIDGTSVHDKITACMRELKAERKLAAQKRRAARLAREAERAMALELIAAA